MEQITQQIGTHNAGWRILRGVLGFLTTASAVVVAENWVLPGWDAAAEAWKPIGPRVAEIIQFLIAPCISFLIGMLTSEKPKVQP